MDILSGELTFLTKSGEEKEIKFSSEKRKEITCGSAPVCDIRIYEDVSDHQFRIYKNECGKVKIQNLSSEYPTLLNDEVLEDKKDLKSGNIITVAGRKMRWETKVDLKRRTAALSKEQKKELKHKYIKTNRRITIHNFAVENSLKLPTTSIDTSSSIDEQSQHPAPPKEEEEYIENDHKTQEATKTVFDKENEKTPSKAAKLNHSGVLLTSYTPPPKVLRTPLVKSAAKNILNKSLNVLNLKTPTSSKNLNSSMHLVDLTTPFVKRTEISSTPKTMSSLKKTPKTIGKTPNRNQTLLKSALKNSSIQKTVPGVSSAKTPISTTKGKVLFEDSPATDTSSIIEVSLDSSVPSTVDEAETSRRSLIEISSNPSAFATPEIMPNDEGNEEKLESQTSNEEVKNLLETISSVLGDDRSSMEQNTTVKPLDTTVERNFNEILEQQADTTKDFKESIFDKALGDVTCEAIENFDKLVNNEKLPEIGDIEKKGEMVLKLIANTRKSLAPEPNETIQIFSSRFSNVTPNDSLTDAVANISQKYDVSTPKLSMLFSTVETKEKDTSRKSGIDTRLTISPVSRLSVTKDSTEMVENYQLNTNNSKSLRSTRKRFGTAMASLHNISQSDTTFDVNESIDMSASENKDNQKSDVNESIVDDGSTNILSLDEQLNSSNKENEYVVNNSIQFYKYTDIDENNKESSTVFEISNEEIDNGDGNTSDSASEISNDDDPEQDEIEAEYLEEEHLDASDSDNNQVLNKFRLSQQDLQEEGINILDISREQLDGSELSISQAEEEQRANISDIDVIPATQQCDFDDEISLVMEADEKGIFAANTSATHEEYPETQQIVDEKAAETPLLPENSFDDDVEIPATQDFNDSELTTKIESNDNLDNSVVELSDTTIVISQEPVNKSDSGSLSLQKISDTTDSDILSQESNIKAEEMEVVDTQKNDESIVSSVNNHNEQENEAVLDKTDELNRIASDMIVNKSIMEEDIPLQDVLTGESLNSNVADTINELIQAPTRDLGEMADVSVCSSSELPNEVIPFITEKIPVDNIDSSQQKELNENEKISEQLERDSAIESCSKIDQSNVDDDTTPKQSQDRESQLFSDTEMSTIDISTSFMNRLDSNEDIEEHQPKTEEELQTENQSTEGIRKELEKVDFYKRIKHKSRSIIPLEVEKPINSRQTMVQNTLNASFEQFIQDQDLKEKEVYSKGADHCIDDDSGTNESPRQKYDEIEMELARMNEEPKVTSKTRAASMLPANVENSERELTNNNVNSNRLTIVPSRENIRKSFLDNLEQEKMELKQKETQALELLEEKPTQKVENYTESRPTIHDEEPCIKKTNYVTTDDNEKTVPDTPSRRRAARVNYSELATGSPARQRKRSASTESNGKKESKSAAVKQVKMESIVEDEVSMKITVTATNITQNETDAVKIPEIVEPLLQVTESEMPENSDQQPESELQVYESQLKVTKAVEIAEQTVAEEQPKIIVKKVLEVADSQPEIIESEGEISEKVSEKHIEKPNTTASIETQQNDVPASEKYTPDKITEEASATFKNDVAQSEQVPSGNDVVKEIVEETFEPETPRKRAKKLNYLELASGSPARTPRRNRTVSTEEKGTISKPIAIEPPETINEESTNDEKQQDTVLEQSNKEPKSTVRSRRAAEKMKSNLDEAPIPSKREKRAPVKVASETPAKKGGRRRANDSVENEVKITDAIENVESIHKESKEDEVIVLSSTQSSVEEPKPVAKRNRTKKLAKVVDVVEEKQQIESTPTRKIRVRKQNEPIPEKEKVDESPAKKRRIRGKNNEDPAQVKREEDPEKVAAKTVKRRAAQKESAEVLPSETETLASPPRKRGKAHKTKPETLEEPEQPKTGRRGKMLIKDTHENKQDESKEFKASHGRGRKHKVEQTEENVEVLAPKRGRKGNNDREPKMEPPVQSKGRGRKVNKEPEHNEEAQPQAAQSSKNEAKTKKAKKEIKAPAVQEVQQESAVPTKSRVRGRKNKVAEEETKPVEVIEISSQSSTEQAPRRGRKGRGKQANTEIVTDGELQEKTEEMKHVSSPKRGRKAQAEAVSEQPATKKPRGRQAKQPAEQLQKSPNVVKTPPSRRNVTKHVTIVTPSTMANEPSNKKGEEEKQPVAKRATKRQAQKSVEEPLAAKRATRAKK